MNSLLRGNVRKLFWSELFWNKRASWASFTVMPTVVCEICKLFLSPFHWAQQHTRKNPFPRMMEMYFHLEGIELFALINIHCVIFPFVFNSNYTDFMRLWLNIWSSDYDPNVQEFWYVHMISAVWYSSTCFIFKTFVL